MMFFIRILLWSIIAVAWLFNTCSCAAAEPYEYTGNPYLGEVGFNKITPENLVWADWALANGLNEGCITYAANSQVFMIRDDSKEWADLSRSIGYTPETLAGYAEYATRKIFVAHRGFATAEIMRRLVHEHYHHYQECMGLEKAINSTHSWGLWESLEWENLDIENFNTLAQIYVASGGNIGVYWATEAK